LPAAGADGASANGASRVGSTTSREIRRIPGQGSGGRGAVP
jgi:hypothetical protein